MKIGEKQSKKKPKERWVLNLRALIKERRISVPRLLDKMLGADGQGRDHIRKVLYGSVPAPLNPMALMQSLAAAIVALNPILENPELEAKEILRRIVVSTAYEAMSTGEQQGASIEDYSFLDQASGYDHLPHEWINTNHSFFRIRWVAEARDKALVIRKFVKDHYCRVLPDPQVVESPTHVTGSDVYRVADSRGNAIFLKVHRHALSDIQLHTLVSAQEDIAVAGIFPDGKYLSPIRTTSDKPWSRTQDDHAAIAYPFMVGAETGNVTHFAGRYIDEIASVARCLAAINTRLTERQYANAGNFSFRRSVDGWDEVYKKLCSAISIPTRSSYLAFAELKLLQQTYEAVKDLLSAPSLMHERTVTLNDLHPHNIFVSHDKCVLIFDYDIRDEWPEVASSGFALHRLCREYVRRNVRTSVLLTMANEFSDRAEELAIEAADAFLTGYTENRPVAAELIRKEGIGWAAAVNFSKLIGILNHSIVGRPDEAGRSEEQWFQELVKFISYLRELRVFANVLRVF